MTCTTHIPKRLLQKALRLILQLVPIQQTELLANKHGTAMGAKMAVAFANIFMGEIEKQILNESAQKPLAWKRCIDDIISFWHTNRYVVEMFIEQANKHHSTIKFTAEISCTDATILDTTIYKRQRLNIESVLNMRSHFKPTQYTFFYNVSPTGSKERLCQRRNSKTP